MPESAAKVPRLKLRLAVAMLSAVLAAAILADTNDIVGVIIGAVSFPFGVWVAYIGVYRSPFLHRLWGIACLVGSVALICVCALSLIGDHDPICAKPPVPVILGALLMPILAYLLLFDRQIAFYRQHMPEPKDFSAPD